LKEAYKTIEEIAAKAPDAKGLSNALEALKRGMNIETSWTSLHKALPQRMAKEDYVKLIKADVFPAGSPANSPIGQAVMNTVMPGVGTAAKGANEAFGKDQLKFEGPDVKHYHGGVGHSHPMAGVGHTHSDGSVPEGEISNERPTDPEGENIFAKNELDLSQETNRQLLQSIKGSEPLRPNAGEPA
jgi:hypothetical protein